MGHERWLYRVFQSHSDSPSTPTVHLWVRCQAAFTGKCEGWKWGKELPKLISGFLYLPKWTRWRGSTAPTFQSEVSWQYDRCQKYCVHDSGPIAFPKKSPRPELSFSPSKNTRKEHPVIFKSLQVPETKAYRKRDTVHALQIPRLMHQAIILIWPWASTINRKNEDVRLSTLLTYLKRLLKDRESTRTITQTIECCLRMLTPNSVHYDFTAQNCSTVSQIMRIWKFPLTMNLKNE